MTLKAKAAQALPGILVGQVEALLQVLSRCLLHSQLLCILLVEEANFLPQRERWLVKVLLLLLDSYSLISQSQLTSRWFFLISPRVCKEKVWLRQEKVKDAAGPYPNFSEGETNTEWGWE